FDIDNDSFHVNDAPFSSALLTSSLFDANYEMSAGTSVKGVNILLDNEWMAAQLGLSSKTGVLHKYLALKASRLATEPLDLEYKKLVQEVIDLVNGNEQFKQIAIQNRILQLIERFFTRIAAKMEKTHTIIK